MSAKLMFGWQANPTALQSEPSQRVTVSQMKCPCCQVKVASGESLSIVKTNEQRSKGMRHSRESGGLVSAFCFFDRAASGPVFQRGEDPRDFQSRFGYRQSSYQSLYLRLEGRGGGGGGSGRGLVGRVTCSWRCARIRLAATKRARGVRSRLCSTSYAGQERIQCPLGARCGSG